MSYDNCAGYVEKRMVTPYGTFKVTLTGRQLHVFLIGCPSFKYDMRICAELSVDDGYASWEVSDELSYLQELETDSLSAPRLSHPGWPHIVFWYIQKYLPEEFTAAVLGNYV